MGHMDEMVEFRGFQRGSNFSGIIGLRRGP
jgi:hypothetical protein